MGDGRYYTEMQFFNIIFLTMAIVFMVIAFMISVYKESEHKRLMTLSGVSLTTALLCRFINEVIYGDGNIIFFERATYVFLLIYILVNGVIYYKINRGHNHNRMMILWCILLLCLPIFMITNLHSFEKIAYSLFVLNFTLLSNKFVKYRVGSSVFSDVKKLMLEFVFITNADDEIIYKSDKVYSQNIFKRVKKMRLDDMGIDKIEVIFCNECTIRNAFQKDFIKVSGEEVRYFQYSNKAIFNKGKLAGHIITFTDITKLIAMLDELKIKQEETEKVNNQLRKYKENVYDLERKKEISVLFSDIANNQYKAMHELKKQIEAVDIDDYFVENIDELIANAKNDLKDVRDAVTEYINYYDEM